MASRIEQAWVAAVMQLGGGAEPAIAAAGELGPRYREPHRRYHTGTHIEAVLADCHWLASDVGLSADERAIADLAACAHDVVYDAHPGVDERASAAWAGTRLAACGLAPEIGARVSAIVLATIAHESNLADQVAGVVLDADLAILAAPPDDYARYVAGVRREYGDVPDADWRAGRAAVLARLLARPVLFATEPARRRWDGPARDNVARELSALS